MADDENARVEAHAEQDKAVLSFPGLTPGVHSEYEELKSWD